MTTREEALRRALTELTAAIEAEAKAKLSADNAIANYSDGGRREVAAYEATLLRVVEAMRLARAALSEGQAPEPDFLASLHAAFPELDGAQLSAVTRYAMSLTDGAAEQQAPEPEPTDADVAMMLRCAAVCDDYAGVAGSVASDCANLIRSLVHPKPEGQAPEPVAQEPLGDPVGMISSASGSLPYKHFIRLREPRDEEVGCYLYTHPAGMDAAPPKAEPVAQEPDREALLGHAIRDLIAGKIKCSDDLPVEQRPVSPSARKAFGCVYRIIHGAGMDAARAKAEDLVRRIHNVLKPNRPSHGFVADLECILDHVLQQRFPDADEAARAKSIEADAARYRFIRDSDDVLVFLRPDDNPIEFTGEAFDLFIDARMVGAWPEAAHIKGTAADIREGAERLRQQADDDAQKIGSESTPAPPPEHWKSMTRTELYRVLQEFMSERDAAKRDAARAFEERNALLQARRSA